MTDVSHPMSTISEVAELDSKALAAAFRVNHHPDAEPSSVELNQLSKSIRAYLAALSHAPAPGVELEQVARAILAAKIDGSSTLSDFLDYEPADAIRLGIKLTEKDSEGRPRFHWYTDIRGDERDETDLAIALKLASAALSALSPSQAAPVSTEPVAREDANR